MAVQASAKANIRISSVRIEGFRAVRALCLAIDPSATALIGANNTGKTSVVDALASAFGARSSTDDDLHISGEGDRSTKWVVDVLFEPAEGAQFDQETTRVLRDAVRPPDGDRSTDFAVLRATGIPTPDGVIQVSRTFLQTWSCEPADGVAEVSRASWPTAQQLFVFTAMDARRDIVADLRSRTSPWGRIVANLELPPEARVEIEGELATLSQKIVQHSSVLQALVNALESVKNSMAAGVDSVRVAPIPPRVDELARSVDVLVQAPHSAEVPMRLQGMGGRSLSALMVFRAFVETRVAQQILVPLAVSTIEEPEAHLHPHAQRAVVGQLGSLGGQRLISTHSPYVAASVGLKSIRLLRREGPGVVCRAYGRDLGPAEGKVVRLVQRRNGEILFARLVVLYEGITEEAFVHEYATRHWSTPPPEALGMSFVAVDGAGGYQSVVPVLDDLSVPWLMLSDTDAAGLSGWQQLTELLGRQIDANSPEVVPVGVNHSLEQALVALGHGNILETAIGTEYGPNALNSHKRLDGQPAKGGQLRDYHSQGWEDRLMTDFLAARKGTYGGPVARALIAAGIEPPWMTTLMQRADTVLSSP